MATALRKSIGKAIFRIPRAVGKTSASGRIACLRDNGKSASLAQRVASLLLLLISAGLFLPLAQPQAADLPACCRRDGKHHCMMMNSSGADGFKSAPATCPYRHLSVLTTPATALPTARGAFARLVSDRTTIACEPTHFELRVSDQCTERGPPLS